MNTFNIEAGPRSGKGERTRARILEVARELFGERGFAATTMRQIAGAAGVSVGNAYYYFASKEHLAHGLHALTGGAFVDRCWDLLEREPRLELRLRGVLEARVSCAEPCRAFATVLFEPASDPASPSHPTSAESKALRAATLATMTRVVEGSNARVHADLRRNLPDLLALFEAGVMRFWARDESPGRARTARLIEHGSALAARLVTLAGLPLMGPLRQGAARLIEDMREPGSAAG